MSKKKLSDLKLKYVNYIKKNGWNAYIKLSQKNQKLCDDYFLVWVEEYFPLELAIWGQNDLPISLKQWFLGLYIFKEKLEFKDWCNQNNRPIKACVTRFDFFDVIDEDENEF